MLDNIQRKQQSINIIAAVQMYITKTNILEQTKRNILGQLSGDQLNSYLGFFVSLIQL